MNFTGISYQFALPSNAVVCCQVLSPSYLLRFNKMISNVTTTEPANAERTVFLKIFAYFMQKSLACQNLRHFWLSPARPMAAKRRPDPPARRCGYIPQGARVFCPQRQCRNARSVNVPVAPQTLYRHQRLGCAAWLRQRAQPASHPPPRL